MQADLRTERFAPNLIESEPRVTVGHASIRQCSSRVAHRSIRFLIVRHSYSAFYQWKSSVATGFCLEGRTSGSGEDVRRTGRVAQCLDLPRGWKDEGRTMNFLHESVPFCLVFLLCIVLFSPESSVSLSADSQGQVDEWTPESFERDAPAIMEGLCLLILCVFQGSAGAQPSREGEGCPAICFLGTSGEPAGKLSAGCYLICGLLLLLGR